MNRLALILLLLFVPLSSTVSAHEDVVPYVQGGKLLTGGHDDFAASFNPVQRIFGYDFFEDSNDPYEINDPGFNNENFDFGLPPVLTLSFDLVGLLRYWDGLSPEVNFQAAPADVSLGINRGANTIFVGGTGTSGTLPTIGSTGSGRVHVHTDSLLNYTDGTNKNLPNAPDGVYLLGLTLKLSGGAFPPSDPFYFVYNVRAGESAHEQAIEWVENNLLVPEPATWALLASGGVGLTAIRRVRRKARR